MCHPKSYLQHIRRYCLKDGSNCHCQMVLEVMGISLRRVLRKCERLSPAQWYVGTFVAVWFILLAPVLSSNRNCIVFDRQFNSHKEFQLYSSSILRRCKPLKKAWLFRQFVNCKCIFVSGNIHWLSWALFWRQLFI